MKKAILIIALLLLGAGVVAYPSISNYIAEKNGSFLADSYDEVVADMDSSMFEATRARAREYNESLLGSPVRDPFVIGSGVVMQADYYELLNINGIMGYIEIPKISVKLPIYHGTSEAVLKKGVGHLEGSTLPIGGIGTHSVLTGHTGLPNARLFTDLTAMLEGDLFFLHILDETLAYKVDEIKVITPEETTSLRVISGHDFCTLLTCTPYGVNSHRLLVRGERTEYIPEEKEAIQAVKEESEADRLVRMATIITSSIMAVLILITILLKRAKLKKAEAAEKGDCEE